MSTFIDDLSWRGLIYQKTPEIERAFERGTKIYFGIDPTGDTLHVGHLLGILVLKRALHFNNKIIVLVGGGTAQIGDPGGKDAERPILPKNVIESNKEKLKKQLSSFFTFDDEKVKMVDNADWLEQVSLINFLRDAGKYISINTMLDKDSVSNRIGREEGISYAEFSYQLLQAYDYLMLYNEHTCEVQIGGSDQWGNIVQGVELIRKKEAKTAHALSFPLIVNPKSGKKFGKTETGAAIWLDAGKTHPFAFFQFFINVEDELAPVLLKYFSFQSKGEIEKIIREWEEKKHERLVQRELAYELTEMIHGKEAADSAKKITSILFEKGSEEMNENDFEFIKHAIPYKTIHKGEELKLEVILPEIGLVSSKTEARRLMEQNGIKSDVHFNKYHLIRKGKKEYGIVEVI